MTEKIIETISTKGKDILIVTTEKGTNKDNENSKRKSKVKMLKAGREDLTIISHPSGTNSLENHLSIVDKFTRVLWR